ncbi:MAG: DUF5060 domain-containing protein [Bacteroidia bacterium]
MRRQLLLLLFIVTTPIVQAQHVSFGWNTDTLGVFDFAEALIQIKRPDSRINPFTDIQITGLFWQENQDTIRVEGFCDSQSGDLFRLRFMPSQTGTYHYVIRFTAPRYSRTFSGDLTAMPSSRKGPIRLDSQYPEHFVYEKSGDHYFWNSTTTYWLLGWKDEKIITDAIDRLASYDINRIRVAINGRAHSGERWSEPTVVESENFTFKLNPWLAARPDDLDDPGFDVSRMNISHWQKLDRAIAHAREKGIVVSIIFYVDGLDHGCDPFKKENMGDKYEQLYYAYAAARYSAYENIMWDIANEYHLFRTPEWAEKMGSYLKNKDPYHHLISVHGKADFPFRLSSWVDVIMYQSWDECGGYPFIMDAKAIQAATGRILPTVNEEYGYEDHYSPWGCGPTAAKIPPDGRSALNRSQLAWEICMAGAYQTTGESARYGTGAGEDTGGGWINGRGNEKMTMLRYYQIMKNIFEKTSYWQLQPANDLVSFGNLCLANPGDEYLIYTRVQHCRVKLAPGEKYSVRQINPRTGAETILPDADSDIDNRAWQYRQNLSEPQVFILKRK